MDIPATPDNSPRRRGFATLTPEKRREIARLGGSAVPDEKRAFSQNRDLARDAGRKGGLRSVETRRPTPDPLDGSRQPAGPGSDAWLRDADHPDSPAARRTTPPGAPGTDEGTR